MLNLRFPQNQTPNASMWNIGGVGSPKRGDIEFCLAVGDIHLKGTVSQNFDLYLSFCFMSKNGQLFIDLFQYYFQNFIENELEAMSKI